MIDIRYAHTPRVGGHPVHQFLIVGATSVVNAGLTSLAQVNWDSQAFYAYVDLGSHETRIIGAMNFAFEEWNGTCLIHWSYTDPEYRRRGINNHLLRRVEQHALDANCLKIHRNTHPKNLPMNKTMESQGYEPSNIGYEKLLIKPAVLTRNPPGKVKT